MNSEWITLTLLIVGSLISDQAVVASPQRYDRLPIRGHSQISGGQDHAPREDREDLCSHCFCSQSKATCDFKQNKTLSTVFNDKYTVPLNIKNIEVRLMAGTKFVMQENFFSKGNQVNNFGVIGVNSNDQVEITSNAFLHNKGGLPSIDIRNMSTVFLREKFLTGADYKLLVEDVDQLTVFPNAFQMNKLVCSLKRIKNLDLMKNAFNPEGATYRINLRVEDSTFKELNSFGVSMGKVMFLRCSIQYITSHTFDVTSIRELVIEDCKILVIESQALTNKLHSDSVAIRDTVIGTIEGQAISQSGITTMTLDGNKIATIRSNGIQIAAVDLCIRNNSIGRVEPNWLSVSQADHVEIENNSFEDYGQCELNIGSANCSFRNNYLHNPLAGSLNFTCRVHQVRVGRECSCQKSWLTSLTDHDLESEVMCRVAEDHRGCLNATSTDVRRFVNEACGTNATRHCIAGQWVTRLASDQLSGTGKYPITEIALMIAVGTVGLVIIFGLLVKCLRSGGTAGAKSQTDKCQMSDEMRDQLRSLAMELAEGDATRKGVLKLINGSPSQRECYNKTLCVLGNMQHKSSRIEALLLQHISQCNGSTRPVGEMYGGGPNPVPLPSAPSPSPSSHGGNEEEPIYQEPDQQLLICGEYSSPAHTEEYTYSEPINAMNANDMPPAYQYATPMRILSPTQQQQQQQRQQTQQASVANYATPVWRSTPSATPTSRPPSGSQGSTTAPRAVKDLRQALQNSPQFHPDQLTSARNQRQVLQVQPPPYATQGHNRSAQVKGQRRRSFECLDGAASLAAMEHMDSGSDHSGGSDVTVQIADVIDYADA
ncbi:uncharacterized protein LOC108094586 [Drosophila ficusphila]|uniref:uncharacterized protein LOC108094586 n=1 Tax=Drosophila ficusphila TaxID=30025 RepID=UPI0007E67491|nr:uncharacterized protein LOC108094586 [Drosophila ficusphila]